MAFNAVTNIIMRVPLVLGLILFLPSLSAAAGLDVHALLRNITHSADDALMPLPFFYLDVLETNGVLSTTSIRNFEAACNAYLLAELDKHFGKKDTVNDINTTVLEQSVYIKEQNLTRRQMIEWEMKQGSLDDSIQQNNGQRRRAQELVGTSLKVVVEVIFDRSPTPRDDKVEDDTREIMQNLDYLVENVTSSADPDLVTVYSIVRREPAKPTSTTVPSPTPTHLPSTAEPSITLTDSPTFAPSDSPVEVTLSPSTKDTTMPTGSPSFEPSASPIVTPMGSEVRTERPTLIPSTVLPTKTSTQPPSEYRTPSPTTFEPTMFPSTSEPTIIDKAEDTNTDNGDNSNDNDNDSGFSGTSETSDSSDASDVLNPSSMPSGSSNAPTSSPTSYSTSSPTSSPTSGFVDGTGGESQAQEQDSSNPPNSTSSSGPGFNPNPVLRNQVEPNNPRRQAILISGFVVAASAIIALIGCFFVRSRRDQYYVDAGSTKFYAGRALGDGGEEDVENQTDQAQQATPGVDDGSLFSGLDDSILTSPRNIHQVKSLSSATTVKASGAKMAPSLLSPSALSFTTSLLAFSEEPEGRGGNPPEMQSSDVSDVDDGEQTETHDEEHRPLSPSAGVPQTPTIRATNLTEVTNLDRIVEAVYAGTSARDMQSPRSTTSSKLSLFECLSPATNQSEEHEGTEGGAQRTSFNGALLGGAALTSAAAAVASRKRSDSNADQGSSKAADDSDIEDLDMLSPLSNNKGSGVLGAFPSFDDEASALARRRRHVSHNGKGDGSMDYQNGAMHPLDWSNKETDSSVGESTISSNGKGLSRTKRFIFPTNDLSENQLNTPRNRVAQSPARSPYSRAASTLSGNTSGSESQKSTSRQLIHDLVWLERKIADVRSSAYGPNQNPRSPPPLDQVDSLSYTSRDVAVSPSSNEGDANDGDDGFMQNIICRDCFAPPGKLQIVIHSTKDGPAVHTVKPGSSLLGHLFPGDLIISVDNVDTRTYSAEQVMKMMASKSRFQRKLTVLHFAKEADGVEQST